MRQRWPFCEGLLDRYGPGTDVWTSGVPHTGCYTRKSPKLPGILPGGRGWIQPSLNQNGLDRPETSEGPVNGGQQNTVCEEMVVNASTSGEAINNIKPYCRSKRCHYNIAGRGPCADVTSQGPGINSSKVVELRESRGLEIAGRGPCADVTSQGPGINSSKVTKLRECRERDFAGRDLVSMPGARGRASRQQHL